MGKNIAVFAAWPYANGDLHLGHVAGAYLPADIFARYHRLRGNKVLFASGSDAHGTPITLKAREEKSTPYEVVTRYHHRFLQAWEKLGISFDLFTHTHTKNHEKITREVFRTLHEKGDLSIKSELQYFDESANLFLPDRYVRGTCPKCGNTRARGDQCEACGVTFEGPMLKDPISIISETTPIVRETSHFYFEMGNYQKPLLDYVNDSPHWRTAVQNFTRSMIEDGLKPRPITRDIDWGVSVPVEGWEQKVIYVWFDAVIGYLSASREWAEHSGSPAAWQDWWKNPDAKSYYFIGKDNVPFHTVIWPIELMAYDASLNLPFDVPANQFLNIDGEKFSTSRGLAVWLLDCLEKFDADALRYYMTSILPETKDANFSWDELITKNNGELVAAWGNLVNRTLGFAFSKFSGEVPTPGEFEERDHVLLKKIADGFETVAGFYETVQLREALRETLALAREVNKYLDDTAPWTTIKTNELRAKTSVYVALKAIDSLKILFAPVLPNTCEKIHAILGSAEPLFGKSEIARHEEEGGSYEVLKYQKTSREIRSEDAWKSSSLQPGVKFEKPTPLFKLLEPLEKLSEKSQ